MAKPKVKRKDLPQYNVVLLNDSKITFEQAYEAVKTILPTIPEDKLKEKITDAHNRGQVVLLVTHKEKAEMYKELFAYHSPPIDVRITPVVKK